MSTIASIGSVVPGGLANTARAHIPRIAEQLRHPAFGAGALASLRRSDPSSVLHQPAFYRLVSPIGELALAGEGALRWATVVHAMAISARPGTRSPPSRRAGATLARLGYRESRFARLLAARGEALRTEVVLLARFVNAHREPLAWAQLGELVLTEGRRERRAEQLRHALARDYHGATNHSRDP